MYAYPIILTNDRTSMMKKNTEKQGKERIFRLKPLRKTDLIYTRAGGM